jgi:hypothetical protein
MAIARGGRSDDGQKQEEAKRKSATQSEETEEKEKERGQKGPIKERKGEGAEKTNVFNGTPALKPPFSRKSHLDEKDETAEEKEREREKRSRMCSVESLLESRHYF